MTQRRFEVSLCTLSLSKIYCLCGKNSESGKRDLEMVREFHWRQLIEFPQQLVRRRLKSDFHVPRIRPRALYAKLKGKWSFTFFISLLNH